MDNQIASLRHQRRDTQIKVFTKWVNSHLTPVNLEVEELIQDMSDGVRLCWLVELISGESLGKLNGGKQRFHRMDNVSRCLNFLSKRFPLKGISAEDVVGANPNAILSLLWLIFLHLQMNSNNNNKGGLTQDDSQNKESLLKWCQTQTDSYPDVVIEDFGKSWSNGLAFNALLHRFQPELVNYEQLNVHSAAYNLNLAFQIAEEKLGVPRLIDVQEFFKEKPDEDAVLIYVAYLYQTFYRPKRQLSNVEAKILDKIESEIIVETKSASVQTLNTPKIEKGIAEKRVIQHPLKSAPATFLRPQKTETEAVERKLVSPIKTPPTAPSKPPPASTDLKPNEKGQLVGANVELAIFPDSWECAYCTFMNTPVTKICAICFTRKSEEATSGGASSPSGSVGEESEEWSEEDEILRRPKKESATTQRISITLESPEALRDLEPSFRKPEPEVRRVEVKRHPEDWDCIHCQFTNPFITKICGSCFTRKIN